MTHVAGWEVPGNPQRRRSPSPHVDAPPPRLAARRPPPDLAGAPAPPAQTAQKAEKPKEKKSLFRRLLGVFK